MQAIDGLIVGCYLIATLAIALGLRRRAAQSIDSYYLGNKKMRWQLLCLSDASGMFDISGTMWLATMLFVYGLKSIWIPWLWPVFNQIFLMAFLAIWLRRSSVRSGAEWILFRFGDNPGSRLSHMSVVAFALVGVIGFLVYGFVGIGKFIELFLPWGQFAGPLTGWSPDPAHVPYIYGIAFTGFATVLVVLGGMPGIVWSDVLQFSIMTLAAFIIAGIAMYQVSPEMLTAAVPDGWMSPGFGWNLGLDWKPVLPQVEEKIAADGFGAFGALFMMMIFSGILKSAAGPTPSYDMQRMLSTRRPVDAAKMTGFVSVVLMPIRYLMITGFTVLALVYVAKLNLVSGGKIDFEGTLPAAIREFSPPGVRGLIITGLLAAFMATFASFLNAAPLYVVNDIYRRYINPEASERRMVRMSYVVSIAVVLISTVIGLFVSSINDALQWIVSGLWGGYAVSNVIKWYWWRFNGYGYFAGMAAGIACSLSFPFIFGPAFPQLGAVLPLYLFPLIILISGAVAVAVSLMTRADDMAALKRFYVQVRPWGFWGPVHDAVAAEHPEVLRNREFGINMFNIVVGTIMQTALVATPIFLVVKNFGALAVTVTIAATCGAVLYRTWYRRLRDWPEDGLAGETVGEAA